MMTALIVAGVWIALGLISARICGLNKQGDDE